MLNAKPWMREKNEPPVPLKRRSEHQDHWLPWARFNLHRNPFGELSIEERARLAVFEDHELAMGDLRSKEAIQLIGDCGHGKTTRLLAILHRFEGASYAYLPEDQPCPPIPFGAPAMIDEAQRLPRRARRQVFATGVPLILATHADLARGLRRFGYRVKTVVIGDQNTPERLARMLNRRIDAARLTDAPTIRVSIDLCEQLLHCFGSNIRAIEHYLYEQVQHQVMQDGNM
mgnify:CR=1 FL=1